MNYECGCERGGDCTKTSMCALDSALQDQAEEFEARIELGKDLMVEVAQHLQRKIMGQDNNEFAWRMLNWVEGIDDEEHVGD